MSETICFVVEMSPVPKGRPRLSKYGCAFTPEKTRQAEREFQIKAARFEPAELLDGPVELKVIFYSHFPKSWSEKKKREHHGYKISRPDLDNLVKLVKDAMEGKFFGNDSQIFNLTAKKLYTKDHEKERIEVAIWETEI